MKKKRKYNKKKILIASISFFLVLLLFLFFLFYLLVRLSLPKVIEVNINSEFSSSYKSKFLLTEIILHTDAPIDTSKVDKYKVIYKYKYLFIKCKKEVTVEVKDREAPVFDSFTDEVEVFLNEEYDESDYEVSDNYDSKEKIKVEVRGEIDTSKVGNYYLVYTATDTSGNKTEKVRKVVVSRKSPLELSDAEFNLQDYFPDTILKETEDMGEEYMNKIVLAGDSVFWYYAIYDLFDKSRVWAKPCVGPDNIYTQNVEVNSIDSDYTIPELIAKNNPEYIILSIGGCQSQDYDVDTFIEEYTSFLKDMQEKYPNTKIIIQPFGPVIESPSIPLHKNSNRNKYNYYVAKMCEELGIPLLDITSILKDENGSCKKNLCMEDGFHPNVTGMKMILDYIRTHGYQD